MAATLSDSLGRDFRTGFRSLRRTPAFTITAVLILGLGIGMSSAMFTVFDAVLVKKLPVQDQERIVELSGMAQGAATEFPLLVPQFRRFRNQVRTLQNVAGFAHWRVHSTAVDDR